MKSEQVTKALKEAQAKSKKATNALKELSKTYNELSQQTRVCAKGGEKILARWLYFQNQGCQKHHLLVQELEHTVCAQEREIQVQEAHNLKLIQWDETQPAEID